ncbi:MAG: endonuclease/exonuclease/phosphatase family protein [Anaerolineae bacterium]|nr:endonuclease/exonuclease/phosphatase family protein [Anaerolineae bacterium]
MRKWFCVLGLAVWLVTSPTSASKPPLIRIATLNTWHGLDPSHGLIQLHSYETAAQREARYQALIEELRILAPDIVGLQEANPLPDYAHRIAADLGYDEIHQVANGGIKFFGWGIPTNVNEGLVILARKELHLERIDARRLSGAWYSFHCDRFSFQLSETRYALAGRIIVQGYPLYIFDVHLHAGANGSERRQREVGTLLSFIAETASNGTPIVLMGDFNAAEDTPEIRMILKAGFQDAFRRAHPDDPGYTWNPRENPNARREEQATSAASLQRIDYVFLRATSGQWHILQSQVAFQQTALNVYPSDHFGVLTEARYTPAAR